MQNLGILIKSELSILEKPYIQQIVLTEKEG